MNDSLLLLLLSAGAAAAGSRVVQAVSSSRISALETEVSFPNSEATISGTLTLPSTPGPFPGVVLVAEGDQTRDPYVFGFRPFRILTDHLAENGVAVLRCDR